MKKALVIVNPTAGRMKIRSGYFGVLQTLADAGIEATTYFTRCQGDATRKVAEAATDYDMIVCCGGDGTLNETISGVLSVSDRKPIGYIPCGSTNDFAATLGLPLQVKEAAAAIAAGQTKKIDVGSFNSRFFTYVASFGAFTSVSYETPQQAKNSLGHFAYLLESTKALGSIRPISVSYDCDGITGTGKYVFGAVSNTTSLAGVYELPKNSVSLCDGQMELILLKDAFYSPETLWNIVHRKLEGDENIVFLHGRHIKLESELPISFTLDGEYGGTVTEADIHCLESAVDIFCPISSSEVPQNG